MPAKSKRLTNKEKALKSKVKKGTSGTRAPDARQTEIEPEKVC